MAGSVRFIVKILTDVQVAPVKGALATGQTVESGSILSITRAESKGTYWQITWGGDDVEEQTSVFTLQRNGREYKPVAISPPGEYQYYIDDDSIIIKGDTLFIQPSEYLYSQADNGLGGYATAPPDSLHPSELGYDIDGEKIRFDTRLTTPQVATSLSDSLSGQSINNEWSVKISNNDGALDGQVALLGINATLYRSNVDTPEWSDYIPIRHGKVKDIKFTNTDVTLRMGGKWELLSEQVAGEIPLTYGSGTFPIAELDGIYYFSQRGQYTGVEAVYDSDGNSLTGWTAHGGIITMPDEEGEETQQSAPSAVLVTAGEVTVYDVFVDILSRVGLDSEYDTAEIQALDIPPGLQLALTDSTASEAINDLLRVGDCHLIEKAGVLTIRQRGQVYGVRELGVLEMTAVPSGGLTPSKNYGSSLKIIHGGNETITNTQEDEIFVKYGIKKEIKYKLNYRSDANISDISERLYIQASSRRPVWNITFGIDISGMELLDSVYGFIDVNGRRYIDVHSWIITKIDKAQDKITLEEKIEWQ